MIKQMIILIAVIGICLSASATIINVPGDQTTIQAGIDTSVDGDTVLVQPGTYIENINFNGHNIVLTSLYLTTGDSSYISSTIIDGDSLGSVVTIESGEDSTTVISGFTIQNGYTEYSGGGIYCYYSNPAIRFNNITLNICNIIHPASAGGGIYCYQSNSKIDHNTVSNNSSCWGGGIYCFEEEPTICDNVITFNYAHLGGGGITCNSLLNPQICHNLISNNFSGDCGGGIYSEGYGTISENIIIDNHNEASWGLGGGGIIFSNATIIRNYIAGNSTTVPGGGIWCGVGIVRENIIVGNSALFGGGIYLMGINTLVENNIIYGNYAEENGGGLYYNGVVAIPVIKNTILWNNSPDNINYYGAAQASIIYCNVGGGWEGEGNIDCDPMFCGPADGDFHLADVSCCLGAGEGGADIGAFGVGCYAVEYLAGDVNMYNGAWPPTVIGGDVTYLVNYFRSLPSSQPCLLGGFWNSADANGDCNVIGSDVTRLVNYFRGQGDISYCPEYPPMWLTPAELPEEAPEGWPGCEE